MATVPFILSLSKGGGIQNPAYRSAGPPAFLASPFLPRPMPSSSAPWRMCWRYLTAGSRTARCWCPELVEGMDETSKQLVEETRTPLPPGPGVPLAYDYEYRRNGVSNLFMLYAPLEALRQAQEASGGGN